MGCPPDVRGQWLVYCYCLPQTRGRLPPPKKILGTGGPPDVSRGPGAQSFLAGRGRALPPHTCAQEGAGLLAQSLSGLRSLFAALSDVIRSDCVVVKGNGRVDRARFGRVRRFAIEQKDSIESLPSLPVRVLIVDKAKGVAS